MGVGIVDADPSDHGLYQPLRVEQQGCALVGAISEIDRSTRYSAALFVNSPYAICEWLRWKSSQILASGSHFNYQAWPWTLETIETRCLWREEPISVARVIGQVSFCAASHNCPRSIHHSTVRVLYVVWTRENSYVAVLASRTERTSVRKERPSLAT